MLNPNFITLGSLHIRWYGVTAALGVGIAFWYVSYLVQLLKSAVDIQKLLIRATIIGLTGARLYHVLNELPFYLDHPALILAIWKGGLAIHGGVLAGALYLFYYASRYKVSFLHLGDLFMPGLLLGQAIGRWGNFFNQELFGGPTSLPWGIFIDPVNRPKGFAEFTHFHPAFLYESLWGLIAVLAITFWIKKRRPKKNGIILGVSLIAWGTGRFIVELLRIDQVPIIFGVRLPLLVSILIALLGGIIVWRKICNIKHET